MFHLETGAMAERLHVLGENDSTPPDNYLASKSSIKDTNKIIVGLSGGVDSSVAAALLLEQGYEVVALFMKNWEEDDDGDFCAAADDLADATQVCEALDIELRTVNFSSEYWDNVFRRFIREFANGKTPNPDVLCNREIKFDVFLDYALSYGAQCLATGHYACREERSDGLHLLQGHDASKDQSYFLYTLGQAELARTLFPLGALAKSEVRELARKRGLLTSDKKDSTGICFIGERPFKAFLSRYLPRHPGPIDTPHGERVGQHDGLPFYTLGQRHGLGIGGRRGSRGEPWYVVAKNVESNTLVVTQGRDHPLLYATTVDINECHWIAGQAPQLPFVCAGKTRYRQVQDGCTLYVLSNDCYRVIFERPQWAPTPGQSVVLYDGRECIGGGVIQDHG